MEGRWATRVWLAALACTFLSQHAFFVAADRFGGNVFEADGLPTAMEVAEAAMRDLMQPGAHVGLSHQQRRLLQEDAAAEALDAAAPAPEQATPKVNLAPDVAPVEELASQGLREAAAAGRSALDRAAQGVQSINQQMRFPNPKNGPTPQYILSKIEDKVQEKAPLIQQKVFKIANDAYQHVDFSAIIDRALALSKNNILGAWPGQNPFGFNLDDKNFCLFAVPVLNSAPKEFNKMLKKGPLDDLEPLPTPEFFVKKPTAVVNAEKNMKSQASKMEKGMQSAIQHLLPTDIGADVSAKSLPGDNKLVLNGLQSVARSTGGNSSTQEGGGTPEVRTMELEGKNWACTPFQPSDMSNPAALSLIQTSLPKSAASADQPALPIPSSAFPSAANDLSGKSGRRLMQDASAEPIGQASVTGSLPEPDMTDTINPAEGKIIDPFYGLPAAKAQTTNPITGEDKFSSMAQDTYGDYYGGAYGDSYGAYGGYGGAYGDYDDSMDFSQFSSSGSYGSLPPVRRPPLVTYNPETGGVVVRPPTSLLQSLGTHVDKFIQGNTGVPFFDCIGVKNAPPLNKFVSLAAKDVQSLSQHFLSYLQTSNGRPVGFQIVNPFNRDAPPINVNFAQQKPYFQLPESGRPGPGSNPFYNFAQNNNLPRLPNVPQPPVLPGPGQPGGPGNRGPQTNFATQRASATQAIPTHNNADFGGHDWQSEQVAAQAWEAAAQAAPASAPLSAVQPALAPVGVQQPEPETAVKEVPVITAAAYDGYLSSCQVIIGSIPHADGTFDKTSDLTTTVEDGFFTLPALQASGAGVAYVVPAAKGNDYPKVESKDSNPGFCFDTTMLLPQYNPLAVPLPTSAASSKIVASPLSTVLVFGMPLGLTQAQLQSALGIDASLDINTLDALAAATVDPNSPEAHVLREAIKISNAVTVGANMLSNDSSTYASFAVTMNQAIAHQATLPSPMPLAVQEAGRQRRLLADEIVTMQLSDPAIVSKVLNYAHQSVLQSTDPMVRDSVSPAISDATIRAASTAIADLNARTDKAATAQDMEKTSYLAQTKVASALQQLLSGEMTAAEFQKEVSSEQLAASLESVQLPGGLRGATPAPAERQMAAPIHAHRLGRGAIIGIVVGCCIAAAVLLGFLALMVWKRRNEHHAAQPPAGVNASGGSGRFWWRSPLWSRGTEPTTTPLAGSSRV